MLLGSLKERHKTISMIIRTNLAYIIKGLQAHKYFFLRCPTAR
jgi:hypothetical protein